jgi:hypothetical protein
MPVCGRGSEKAGAGGIKSISLLFGRDEKTIRRGIRDLQSEEVMNQAGV